ncbi:cytochrome P450 [Streptomyces sp. NPDC021093]|uniref:cytochrome P450 n=1 Tax=Streptomyces sp. NPDC021093 TaxID=3365112 RepID=UPI0037BBB7D4
MQHETSACPAGHGTRKIEGAEGTEGIEGTEGTEVADLREREPVTLPTARASGCPFNPPAGLGELRDDQAPLVRMRYPDGHIGWLATGYDTVRSLFADSRFSARYELMHYPFADIGELPPAPVGDMTGMDAPEHTRYRKLLVGKFTVRRMRALTERVEEITAEYLDAMERKGGPLDLVKDFAQPIPALMICELLGVPSRDREMFQEWTLQLTTLVSDQQAQYEAMNALGEYVHKLVLNKRVEPTDDLLSDLTTTDLTDEELAGVGSFLLGAGLDTTANMIAHGTFALLSNPDQLAALRDDPALAPQAVEELMRYLTIAHTTVKTATEDVELDGRLIKAGETVTMSIEAANRDPLRFPDPDTLDLHRKATGHLGFGHGIHQCLGQQLARVEMQVALPALVARFPDLRLAVPSEDIPLRTGKNIFGVHNLPVTWGEV